MIHFSSWAARGRTFWIWIEFLRDDRKSLFSNTTLSEILDCVWRFLQKKLPENLRSINSCLNSWRLVHSKNVCRNFEQCVCHFKIFPFYIGNRDQKVNNRGVFGAPKTVRWVVYNVKSRLNFRSTQRTPVSSFPRGKKYLENFSTRRRQKAHCTA